MSDDEVVTYEDAAQWLGQDVRLSIEITRPCLGGGLHYWEHQSVEVPSMESTFVRKIESWRCRDCSTFTSADPAAISGRWKP